MTKILVVYHSMSGNTKAAAEAVAQGAKSIEGTEVATKEGLKAESQDLIDCDGVAVGTPDYFSYMAGGLKDFFDRTFYPTKGEVEGKPCAIFVTHGGGGTAVESVQDIAESFKFEEVAEPVLVRGGPNPSAREKLFRLGEELVNACKA